MDYKDWIQQKTEELAAKRYNCDYFMLDENQQAELFNLAVNEYHDYYSVILDAKYDITLENNLMEK